MKAKNDTRKHGVTIRFKDKKVRDLFARWYERNGNLHFFSSLRQNSGKFGHEYARRIVVEWPELCETIEKSDI